MCVCVCVCRAEQRDLEERLRRLREEEDRLDKDGRAGAQLQQQADEVGGGREEGRGGRGGGSKRAS